MSGGLIQIVSYGSQNLYLTGSPEITYFKTVYRRHTNFAVESIILPFDNEVNFDETSVVKIPGNGDLLSKMYLQITVPEFSYPRTTSSTDISDAETALETAKTNLSSVTSYMAVNIEAYREAYSAYSAANVVDSSSMITAIETIFGDAYHVTDPEASSDIITIVNTFAALLDDTNFSISYIGMNEIAYDNSTVTDKDDFYKLLNVGLSQSIKVKKYFTDLYNDALDTYNDVTNENRNFAWVSNLGNSVLEYVDISIGGQTIDRHYSQYLEVDHELFDNTEKDDLYNKMIGNVSDLTTYDRTTKPSYTMMVPLKFWCCKNNGLALPLIALQYQSVDITVKTRDILSCAYMELEDGEVLGLDDVFSDLNLHLEMNLVVDYIYLDMMERKKFAQSSHEYLIEQVQTDVTENIEYEHVKTILDFSHPSKELIWAIQKDVYTENTDSSIRCEWNNFSLSSVTSDTPYETNPVLDAEIVFNGYHRIQKYDGNYFNYVQPNEHHTRTPSDGINMYAFCLHPEEHQPSATCNLSRIAKPLLNITLNSSTLENDSAKLWVFSKKYNILRFVNGMGGVAYT